MDLDLIIVVSFLIITFIIGIRSSTNIKDISEYAIASKLLGGAVLTITILATYITGSKGVGFAGRVFSDGMLPVIRNIICGVIGCFLFIIFFILPRIKYFDGCLTMGEMMGKIYGRSTRITIGILGCFYSVTLITVQIMWLGNVGELLGISSIWSVLVGGAFLVIYASRGGMKSVAITDVLQFVMVAVMVPVVAYVLFCKVGGIKSLIDQVPSSHFEISTHARFPSYKVYFIWYLFPAFPLSFPFIQRMLMAREQKDLINSYYVSVIFLVVFFLLLAVIGLSAVVLRESGEIAADIPGNRIFVHIINTYFDSGVKGILCIGLIAGIMSTADSFLNSAGLLLTHDFIKPVFANDRQDLDELTVARRVTFILGLISLILAYSDHILPAVKHADTVHIGKGINIGSELVALIFTIPLIAGIMGLKGSSKSFFIPSIITTIFFVTGKIFFDNSMLVPFTIGMNILSFLTTHYLINLGFVTVKQDF